MSRNISMTNVLRTLSDQETQKMLKAIIETEENKSQLLINQLGLSNRQYYNRINNLVTAGLIRRQKGKYRLSSFGKVIYSLQKIVERAAHNYWKLEAIDAIIMSDNSNLADVEYMKIIDILLDDVGIKDIFLHGHTLSNKSKPREKEHNTVLNNTTRLA
jgi:predicted transcriptional regulator